MHVGAEGLVAERILGEAVGAADPLARGVEGVGVGLGPAGLRRLEVGLRGGDDLDQFLAEQRHVARIGVGAEAAH